MNKVQCKALIVSPRFKSSDYLAILLELAPELRDCEPGRLIAARLPALEFVIRLGSDKTPGMLNFDELLSDASADEQAGLDALGETLQFDDPINIQFTSGTTGAPKAATLTHHNILNNGFFVGQAMQFTENDRLCIPVPLYHIFGMVLGNLVCMTHGATMVYPGEGFDAKSVLETIEAERCTALHGVPTMFIAELDHPEVCTLRPLQPAHRHHGRRALSGGGDEEGRRAHAHAAGDDRLRHDRDLADFVPELDG